MLKLLIRPSNNKRQVILRFFSSSPSTSEAILLAFQKLNNKTSKSEITKLVTSITDSPPPQFTPNQLRKLCKTIVTNKLLTSFPDFILAHHYFPTDFSSIREIIWCFASLNQQLPCRVWKEYSEIMLLPDFIPDASLINSLSKLVIVNNDNVNTLLDQLKLKFPPLNVDSYCHLLGNSEAINCIISVKVLMQ